MPILIAKIKTKPDLSFHAQEKADDPRGRNATTSITDTTISVEAGHIDNVHVMKSHSEKLEDDGSGSSQNIDVCKNEDEISLSEVNVSI